MKMRKKLLWYALFDVAILLSLAVVSASAHIHGDPQPTLTSQMITIDELVVYEFDDPFFEVYTRFSSQYPGEMYFKITHVMIYPDGEKEQQSWLDGTIHYGQSIEMWILCMYMTEQYGKYTWVATITDEKGTILDQESITWEREPVP